MNRRKGRRLRCRHCRYEWTYGGKSKYYANCPRCHFQVHVVRGLIKSHRKSEPESHEASKTEASVEPERPEWPEQPEQPE